MQELEGVVEQVAAAKERVEELSVLLVAANTLDQSAALQTGNELSDL